MSNLELGALERRLCLSKITMSRFFKKRAEKQEGESPADEAGTPSGPSPVDEPEAPAKGAGRRIGGRRQKKERPPKKKKERPSGRPLFSRKKKDLPETAPAGEEPAEGAEGETVAPDEADRPGKKGAPKGREKTRSRGAVGGGSPPIGLDLDRSSITAVRVRHQASGTMLMSVAVDRLPEGLIQEGEVRDADGLGNAIREFWKEHGIKGRKVYIGLANQKIVVRTLEFPMLDKDELRSAIEFQAQDYIPIPLDEAVIDFHVLGTFRDEQQIEKQKVLVVAAQKVMVMEFVNALKKARLNIAGIDMQAFALSRSLISRSFLDEGAPAGQAVAIINIASDVTNLVVDAGGEPQFTRIISFGGDDFTRAVQEQLSISFAEAEAQKARVGLARPDEQPEAGEPGAEHPELPSPETAAEEPTLIIPPQEEGEPPEEGGAGGPPRKLWAEEEDSTSHMDPDAITRRALEITADSFGDEVRRSLDYYLSQEESLPLGKLILSGSGSMLDNLDSHLAQLFPYEVTMGNPLARIAANNSELGDEELKALAPHLSIAIGLVLEDES